MNLLMNSNQEPPLTIACWGNPDFLRHLANSVGYNFALRPFKEASHYAFQEKDFFAHIFFIVSRETPGDGPSSGVRTMLTLRGLFDCHQPVILCTFEPLRLLNARMGLSDLFRQTGCYIHLRLPISISGFLNAVNSAEPCVSTLDIKPILSGAGFFSRIRHDLPQTTNKKLIKLYRSALSRYGESE